MPGAPFPASPHKYPQLPINPVLVVSLSPALLHYTHKMSKLHSFQLSGLLPKPLLSSHPSQPCACGPTQEDYPDIAGVCRIFQSGRCGYKTSHQEEEEERVHCCVICLKLRKNIICIIIIFFQLRSIITCHIIQGVRYGGHHSPLRRNSDKQKFFISSALFVF